MGNSVSDSSITVLCNCQNEMISTTPSAVYQQRIRCCGCNISIAHIGIMFHCPKSNNPNNHKYRYDLCESCSKEKALNVFCKHCNKKKMKKIPINVSNKRKKCKCNQCEKDINQMIKNNSNQYIYECKMCNNCIICVQCAKNPSIMFHKQQQYINKINKASELIENNYNIQKVMTTLHEYQMCGPYTPNTNMVWYCDNPMCQYTKYGAYRRYSIQNWRSCVFGKKYVLCDQCVRKYEKQQAVNPIFPNQTEGLVIMNHNNDSEGIEPEGIVSTNNNNVGIAKAMLNVTAKMNDVDNKPIDDWWYKY